ncbi:nuclear transport factor 2 family protein, partial [Salmonella enterica subsp. enterica serovar Newport]|nr:nuclear transport factor 2 family protein [Salmonella enterica subsp. enterica serovar Newport]
LMGAAAVGIVRPAAASLERDVLARWYALLQHADANALSGLMARNARVQLVDLGVTQTKQEFLGSMSEFAQAMKGGKIRYRVERAAANSASALVCYNFASNDVLARESFTFQQGLIATSVQETVAQDCNDFPAAN